MSSTQVVDDIIFNCQFFVFNLLDAIYPAALKGLLQVRNMNADEVLQIGDVLLIGVVIVVLLETENLTADVPDAFCEASMTELRLSMWSSRYCSSPLAISSFRRLAQASENQGSCHMRRMSCSNGRSASPRKASIALSRLRSELLL